MSQVKVSREVLLDKLRSRREELQKKFEKDRDAYEPLMETYHRSYLKELQRAAKEAELGRFPKVQYGNPMIKLPDTPVKPVAPSFTKISKDIALLELSFEETITVRNDSDWVAYL